jgi:hypothetical protein
MPTAKVAQCRRVHALHADAEARHSRLDRSARITTLVSSWVALKGHLCTVCKAKPIAHARDRCLLRESRR